MYELNEHLNHINNETRYWLVRTMTGRYYGEYTTRGFIAIRYNEIQLDDLRFLPKKEKPAKKALQSMLKERNDKLKNTSYPSGQLLRFYRDIKTGDVVIVPSSESHEISFGVVESDVYEDTKDIHSTYGCSFAKRRKVKWLKKIQKYKLSASMQLMFNSRHIVSEVTGYSNHIDSFLNDLYVKDGVAHLVLRVKQENELSADDFTFISDLMCLFNEYSNENNLGITSKDIKMKISVQSPGDILAFAQSPYGVALLGLFIMFLKGGTFNINNEYFNFKIEVPKIGEGISKIIKSVNEFLNDRKNRELKEALTDKIKNMEIDAPDDLIKLLDAANKSGSGNLIE